MKENNLDYLLSNENKEFLKEKLYETVEKSSDLVVITIVKKSEDNIEFLIK